MTPVPEVRVAGTGLWLPDPEDREPDRPRLPVDVSRLRRMDRFARSGFFAGSLSLVEAGIAPHRPPDATLGVVFGTAHGCRDSLIDFTLELGSSRSVEQLSPALFAETVHNTVNGELAIAWGLGGPSETIASGRTGGADAILRGAELVRAGRAAAVVAGGAEGIHPRMLALWERELSGKGAPDSAPRDAGAALVLGPTRSNAQTDDILLASATRFFEPDPSEAARRMASWIDEVFEGMACPLLLTATPDVDGAFLAWSGRHVAVGAGELYGAAGAVAAVHAVREIRNKRTKNALVASRDPAGQVTLLAFVTPRRG